MSSFPGMLLLILAGVLGTATSRVVTAPPQRCSSTDSQLRQMIMVTVGPDFDTCLKASSSCDKKDGCCVPSILKSNCDNYDESLCSGETCGCCLMNKVGDSSEEKSSESNSSESGSQSGSGSGSNSGSGSGWQWKWQQ
ncbi:unnamed protein product [Meganyctiphanes norvegica]|uniref:WAP domain-containing protein n=1 Tax=Meganyctiphanes norvegica TaxID=48144 RepID=A0AAV2SFW0_MEGNR